MVARNLGTVGACYALSRSVCFDFEDVRVTICERSLWTRMRAFWFYALLFFPHGRFKKFGGLGLNLNDSAMKLDQSYELSEAGTFKKEGFKINKYGLETPKRDELTGGGGGSFSVCVP